MFSKTKDSVSDTKGRGIGIAPPSLMCLQYSAFSAFKSPCVGLCCVFFPPIPIGIPCLGLHGGGGVERERGGAGL